MQIYQGNKPIYGIYLGNQTIQEAKYTIAMDNYLAVDYLIVAGGGGGGYGGPGGGGIFNSIGGGGGAGGLLSGSISLTPGVYPVTIGDDGNGGQFASSTKATNGGNSIFLGLTALGGGGGGAGANTCAFASGSSGGSGGGGGSRVDDLGCPTATGSLGQGFNGASEGGGGGASGVGTTTIGGAGSVWLNGTTYSQGGDIWSESIKTALGSGGRGAAYFPLGTNGQNGVEGTVIVRYFGSGSRAIGGTVSFSDGYTYHFYPAGTYTFTIPEKGTL